jgi:hypothetical protein
LPPPHACGRWASDQPVFQRLFQRPEGQITLVVALEPQLRWVFHRIQHVGPFVPVVGIGKFDDLDIVHGHAVDAQHQLDALMFLNARPIVLDGIQVFGQADFLELFPRPAQFLIDIAGRNQRAVGVMDLAPVEGDGI